MSWQAEMCCAHGDICDCSFNLPQNLNITIFPKLKGLEYSFLFLSLHFPPHWVSNVPNYRLPQNWALEAPKPPKMGKITIFPKLKGLECLFLLLSLHFPPHYCRLLDLEPLSSMKTGSELDEISPGNYDFHNFYALHILFKTL